MSQANALVLCDARITLELAIDGLLDDAGLFFGNSHVDDLIAFPRRFLTLPKRNRPMLPRIRKFSSRYRFLLAHCNSGQVGSLLPKVRLHKILHTLHPQ